MVNEDIVTALRNAVDRGESLENAMKMLINSGYPPNEVQDASKFIGFVQISSNNKNTLTKPEQKNILIKTSPNLPVTQPQFSRIPLPPKLPPPNQLQQIQQFSNQNPRYPVAQQLPQRITSPQEIKSEISSKPTSQIQMRPPLIPQQNASQQIPRYQPNLPSQIAQEAPEKPSYKKEIFLLIILLLLIGILITTILFREKILAFFS